MTELSHNCHMARLFPSGYIGSMAKKSLLQNSGNGIGPQILVDARMLSDDGADEAPVKGTGKGRKTKLAALGLSLSIIREGDADYAKCLDQANKFRRTRMKEMARTHGHVSAGVGAMLASSALALAGSRYLYQLAAKDGSATLLKEAANLADKSRQSDLAAWEICSREGTLARRRESAEAGMPWVTEVERKPGGRPTKLQLSERETDHPKSEVVVESLMGDDDA